MYLYINEKLGLYILLLRLGRALYCDILQLSNLLKEKTRVCLRVCAQTDTHIHTFIYICVLNFFHRIPTCFCFLFHRVAIIDAYGIIIIRFIRNLYISIKCGVPI